MKKNTYLLIVEILTQFMDMDMRHYTKIL
jgi:hypothetical protein